MKRPVIVSIILLLSVLRLTAQADKNIKADIKHVTVFPDRAQINQEAEVSLLPGKTILMFRVFRLKDLENSPYCQSIIRIITFRTLRIPLR
jgi:hypothetical protein